MINLYTKRTFNTSFIKKNLLSIIFFINMVWNAEIEKDYDIEKEPILVLDHLDMKLHVGVNKKSGEKFLIKTIEYEPKLTPDGKPEPKTISRVEDKEIFEKILLCSYPLQFTQNNQKARADYVYSYKGEVSLLEYIETKKSAGDSFKIDEALLIIKSILTELQHFNGMNLYLVNLNLQNILMRENLDVLVLDFYFLDLNNKNKLFTNFYGRDTTLFKEIIAPEILKGNAKASESKCDIYSFGKIMEKMLPYINFGPDADLKSKVEKEYNELMQKCLEEEISQRIDLENALLNPLIELTSPIFYEFNKLDKSFFDNDEFKRFNISRKGQDTISFKKDAANFEMRQAKHRLCTDSIIHRLYWEDFIFFVNGKLENFLDLSSDDITYIKELFDVFEELPADKLKPYILQKKSTDEKNLFTLRRKIQAMKNDRKSIATCRDEIIKAGGTVPKTPASISTTATTSSTNPLPNPTAPTTTVPNPPTTQSESQASSTDSGKRGMSLETMIMIGITILLTASAVLFLVYCYLKANKR